MGDKIKIDIGLGKAAAINALGGMASQGIKSGTELQAQRRAQEHAKIEEIETFVFSSDYTEFAKQFLGMEEDYKSVVKANNNIITMGKSPIATAYRARLEKEISVITATNPDIYAKAKPMFDEFKGFLESTDEKLKKKRMRIIIIGAAVFVVLGIAAAVCESLGM